MTPSWKDRLPFLLRLSFVLPVVLAVVIKAIVSWPLWGEAHHQRPVMEHGALDVFLQRSAQIEHDRLYNSGKKIGVLTYIKRNRNRWLKKYDKYKVKQLMKKLDSVTATTAQKSSE